MRTIICLSVSTLLATAPVQHSLAAGDTPLPRPFLKVMSFNIRYGTANDGANSWPQRRQLVLETIRVFQPDLLGLQEVLDAQATFLKENLPEYTFVGVGRDDGVRAGEFAPVMFRKDRFALEDSGQFWLSERPEVAGSKGWDAALPRLLTWVLVRDRQAGHGPFVFANTHFDHRGRQARIESAKLIREKAGQLPEGYPCILTGDFNSTEDGQPYAVLVKGEGVPGGAIIDSYRVIHPRRSSDEATFHDWTGNRQGSRIDWIVQTDGFLTLSAAIDYFNEAGRYPSDHYPVEAVLLRKTSVSTAGAEAGTATHQ